MSSGRYDKGMSDIISSCSLEFERKRKKEEHAASSSEDWVIRYFHRNIIVHTDNFNYRS
eukprot:gene33096-42810_t